MKCAFQRQIVPQIVIPRLAAFQLRQRTALAVSPDGQVLASSSHQTIRLWNLQLGKGRRSLRGHTDWVTALAFSPDGQTLASSSLDRTIKLWNLTTGELLQTFQAGRMTCLQFSPDGQTLVAGSRNSRWADGAISPGGIQRWDLATGQALPTIGTEPVATLAFSRDGQILGEWVSKGAAVGFRDGAVTPHAGCGRGDSTCLHAG